MTSSISMPSISSIRTIYCIGNNFGGNRSMAVIADRCPPIRLRVMDLYAESIVALNNEDPSHRPVFERDLEAMEERGISKVDMVFISVNTRTERRGLGAGQASDLRRAEGATRSVADHSQGPTIVGEKGTLLVRTAEDVQAIRNATQGAAGDGETATFSVLSNPGCLAEGTAIADLEQPDRVLIGGEDPAAIEALAAVYAHWVPDERILRTNLWSSELSKLTAKAIQAQRKSSIHSIAGFCESTGDKVLEVGRAIGADSRIDTKTLQAGSGFGGSCFHKDILNLVYLCGHYGLHEVASYWQSVVELNDLQQHRITRLAVLGFGFKADTNDTREAPAIRICRELLEQGAQLAIHDPKVGVEQICRDLGLASSSDGPGLSGEDCWQPCSSGADAAGGVDAVLILTKWQQFSSLPWAELLLRCVSRLGCLMPVRWWSPSRRTRPS